MLRLFSRLVPGLWGRAFEEVMPQARKTRSSWGWVILKKKNIKYRVSQVRKALAYDKNRKVWKGCSLVTGTGTGQDGEVRGLKVWMACSLLR